MANDKLNIFLDLDHTLIHSELYTPDIIETVSYYYYYDFVTPYITAARPHLQEFLDFLFETCNVCIWTAGSKPYALSIQKKFIEKFGIGRDVKLTLYNSHGEVSHSRCNKSKGLEMLWGGDWNVSGYNKNNTFIIDDLKEVYDTQPDNCLPIKQFRMQDGMWDTELLSMMDKIKKIQADYYIK